jgi:hypothetical protein
MALVNVGSMQIYVPGGKETTAATQINALLEGFGWQDAVHSTGIAMAAVQLWYYHYPIPEVRES